MKLIKIFYKETGELIAEGPAGWRGIAEFEGNYYINKKCLKTNRFKISYIPGFCIYKFLYVWINYVREDGKKDWFIGWKYFLTNPLFFFIGFKIGLNKNHPKLRIEKTYFDN